jgi:GT2 family glycosyltransferase
VIGAIEFVCATRLDEAAFRERSALALSIRRLNDPRLHLTVAFANRRPLAEVYNAAIESGPERDVVVFLHDDLWLDDFFILERIVSGLAQFDVIGIVGNRRRRQGQRGWAFVSAPGDRDDPQFLSGRIAQAEHPCGQVYYFGPAPASCELLDGVFLATRKSLLLQHGVRFDARFAFHCYDLDFCRGATAKGLRLGTWPICLTHQSHGEFASDAWKAASEAYLAKWAG